MEIGKSTKLNPFLKEIWAVKYGTEAAQIFVARDGYRKSAQANTDYDYHFADAVHENDDLKIVNGEITHSYSLAGRGQLVGAYAIAKRKSSTKPVFNYVEFREYYQGNKKNGEVQMRFDKYKNQQVPKKETLWDTKPATMIKKVAEAQVLRMAFQELFAGTYDESEVFTEQAKVEEVKVNVEEIIKTINEVETQEEFKKVISELSKVTGLTESDKVKIKEVVMIKKKILTTPSESIQS